MGEQLARRLIEAIRSRGVVFCAEQYVPGSAFDDPVFKRSARFENWLIELFIVRYTRWFFQDKIWFGLEVDGIRTNVPQEVLGEMFNAINESDEQNKKNLLTRLGRA